MHGIQRLNTVVFEYTFNEFRQRVRDAADRAKESDERREVAEEELAHVRYAHMAEEYC